MVSLNPSALVLMAGNGLTVSEDLARQFITIELDARTRTQKAETFRETSKSRLHAAAPSF
jgi:hypothetical protein